MRSKMEEERKKMKEGRWKNKKGQEENPKNVNGISYNPFSKKGQEENSKRISNCLFNKKGQEEMVGFVLIVVLVSVAILILLMIMLYNRDDSSVVQSYEVESFVSAILTYSSDCSESFQDHLSVQKLISRCMDGKNCEEGKSSCEVLEEILSGTINESWGRNGSYVKGYRFRIDSELNKSISLEQGILNGSSRAGFQELLLSGKDVNVSLEVYG